MAMQHFAFAFVIYDAVSGIKLDASCAGNHFKLIFVLEIMKCD
jgi:hypothetical protein